MLVTSSHFVFVTVVPIMDDKIVPVVSRIDVTVFIIEIVVVTFVDNIGVFVMVIIDGGSVMVEKIVASSMDVEVIV